MFSCEVVEFSSCNVDFTPHDCRWIPTSARFVVPGSTSKSTGRLAVLEATEDGVDSIAEIDCTSGIKCCTFGASPLAERLVTCGNFDGTCVTWDIDMKVPSKTISAHSGIIHAIDGISIDSAGYGAPELVTGGADGYVKVWDTRQPDAVATFRPSSTSTCECWTVAFGNSFRDEERCVLAGYENGDVKLYDLRTGKVRCEMNVGNGVCSIEFDRRNIRMNKFICSCLESQCSVFDARTQHSREGFASTTHRTKTRTTLWGVRHLPQDREISAILLGDGSIELYRYKYPEHRRVKTPNGEFRGICGELKYIGSYKIASQPINALDWHSAYRGLAVCTGLDQRVRVLLGTHLKYD